MWIGLVPEQRVVGEEGQLVVRVVHVPGAGDLLLDGVDRIAVSFDQLAGRGFVLRVADDVGRHPQV